MKNDAFSRCHPAVNFLFFLGAILSSALLQHPAYLLASLSAAAVYSDLLLGRKGLMLGLLPIVLLVALINPIFSTDGRNVLFTIFSRPYTLEALICGGVNAAMLLSTVLWFACYGAVLTNDKFMCLFGPLLPSVSLLLVMVFRFIPRLMEKIQSISVARRCIGKGIGQNAKQKDRLKAGTRILSAVTDDALEGSVETADAMRARGYGYTKRTSFQLYRMTARDICLLLVQAALLLAVILAGHTGVRFVPIVQVQSVSWGFGAYCLYVYLPIILHCKEVIVWRISRSKI